MFECKIGILLAKKEENQVDLHRATKIPQDRIRALKKGEIKLLGLKELETLCRHFDCEINDLYVHKKD